MPESKKNNKSLQKTALSIAKWLKVNNAIIVASLLLMPCFGIMDTVVAIIDNTLLLITNHSRNLWLDWFFIILTITLIVTIWRNWIREQKRVSSRAVGLLIFLITLYLYFRFTPQSPYVFTSYWNGPITYLDGFAAVGFVIIGLFVYQQIKKAGGGNVNDKNTFVDDTPIRGSSEDLFSMENLVNRIVDYIAFTDVQNAAFSMGIVGEWGDGKTSLMNLVEEKIKEKHTDFILMHFNPRGSKNADFIQEDFLKSLKQALLPFHSSIDRTIDKYAVALDVIPGIPPIISKGLDLLQISTDKEREVRRRELSSAIKEIDRKIVVLIDDLDRLTGEELIEVLKVLDVNGAFSNMVFVTAYDKGYVNTVLNGFMGLDKQQRPYTDKYFTVEIAVPLHPSFRLMDYLVKLLTDASNKGFIKLQAAAVEATTRGEMNLIMPRLRTIRDVKRFANQFLYDYAEVQREVAFRDYLLLELIKYAHPKDYEAIYRLQFIHRGLSFSLPPSSDMLFYLDDKLVSKKNKAGNGYDEPEVKPDSIDILGALFPDESSYKDWYEGRYPDRDILGDLLPDENIYKNWYKEQYQKIYSVSSFEYYFYNYEYSHLKADDIDQLFREKSINDVSKLIDNWEDFSKDLETFLLTKDVNSIKNKNELRRYMQVLLYFVHKHQSINYLSQSCGFLRSSDVEKMMKNCGFATKDEYIKWFKDSMAELTDIDPMIPANYMKAPINTSYSDQAEPSMFVISQQEMQEYALDLLKDYLKDVEKEEWNVSNAYYMTQIQSDEKGTFLPDACRALHDAMVKHFGVFSSSLPFFTQQEEQVVAGFNDQIRFKAVFEDTDEFENLISSSDNDEAPEIELIRAIWPIYKANGFRNFTLPKGVSIEEAKRSKLKSATENLTKYEMVGKKIDELAEDWKKTHRLSDVELYVKRATDIAEELEAISLELKLKETYRVQLQNMQNLFRENMS